MDLSSVPQMVARHVSGEVPGQSRAEREKESLRRVGKTLFAGIVMLAIGMAVLAFEKQSPVLRPIGLFAVLLGMLTAAFAVISPMWRTGLASKPKSRTTRELGGSPALLPEQRDFVPLPSVTEPTTKLLGIDRIESGQKPDN